MARLLMILFLCSPVAGQTAQSFRKILRLEEAWRSAQQRNDKAAFDRLLAADVSFVGTSGSLRDKGGFGRSCEGSGIPRAPPWRV